jgi:hypothetical protein
MKLKQLLAFLFYFIYAVLGTFGPSRCETELQAILYAVL